ncbi:hypothetical protein HQ865_01765 [Mucilaginibacter mali]|uniref:Uncharacterized protein n=1 Tax=Mucilaginibacter mali TaxID=2740462 RepID=A0A7D4TSR3_9SPHI|nr:hypothetical protein [Mucilaginibacter mali]QKJ28535.1 hypothetical protein HQ865_01765 [Mucilaginibacter mali]
MTIITVESDPKEKLDLLLKYAEELGLSVKTEKHRVLSDDDITFGFGRPATEAELEEYFAGEEDEEPIDIETVFAKYADGKH